MEKIEAIEKIKEFYDLESLKNIVNSYFEEEGKDFIKKSEFAELIAGKIYDGSIKKIFEGFGKAKQELFKECLEYEIAGVREMYRKYNIQITDSVMEEKFSFNYSKTKIYPEYSFFKYEQPGHWEKESAGIIYIDGKIAKILRSYIFGEKKQEIYYKEPSAKYLFSNTGSSFQFLKRVYDYYSTLNYSQKEKMLKNDLKDFREYLDIEEFYEKRGEFPYLRSSIITSFLNSIEWNKAIKIESEESAAQFFIEFINGKNIFKEETYVFLQSISKHLKGLQSIWEESEDIVLALKLFKEGLILTSGKWVSADEFIKILRQSGIGACLISYDTGSNYMYINSKDYGRLRIVGRKLYDDTVIKAFIKNFLFLFAAFGLVQVNYDDIEDETIFGTAQGLRSFKLTNSGEYILGICEKTTVEEDSSPKLEFAETRRVITLLSDAPAEKMILDRCGEKIADDTYYISFYTLTKDCKKIEEVEEKLMMLQEKIVINPTGIWEEFFRESRTKIIASQEEIYRVFKIENIELAKLFITDIILKELIIKAEGQRIAVKNDDIVKVRNRVREKGYFWEVD